MIRADPAVDRAAAAEWARQALQDERCVILDTETTDLRGYVCDIAIVRAVDGEVLMDRLINPGVPIGPGAAAVHGISDAQVAGAVRFGEILPELRRTLDGRRVLVYNAAYDSGRFVAELIRWDPTNVARTGLFGWPWECIMLQHAAWVGEWNEHHGNYRWHKLTGGDHRALGDCRAARARLQEMAGVAK